MMPTAELVAELLNLIEARHLPAPVLDPVLRSTSGYELIEESAIEILKREVFPLARLITPNIPEAEVLTGISINNEEGMRAAAQELRDMGARTVLIKGGHLEDRQEEDSRHAIDLLDDQGEVTVFREEWIDSASIRGTGCMLSAGIAACLAQGLSLVESVRLAKAYVAETIRFEQTIERNAVSS
jgi:hydroxymethylpyrimidine kinase/phosphomethylpyrimidine kinase